MGVADKHFALKRWGTNEDNDTESTLRAFIHHRWTTPAGEIAQFISLFPPTQYKSTDDEHAFALALEEELKTLDWQQVKAMRGDEPFPKLTRTNTMTGNSDPISVGDIGNYYGGLYIHLIEGKYYWGIVDYDDDFGWEEIPKDLYNALLAYENLRKQSIPCATNEDLTSKLQLEIATLKSQLQAACQVIADTENTKNPQPCTEEVTGGQIASVHGWNCFEQQKEKDDG
jgi:hypothetical protein